MPDRPVEKRRSKAKGRKVKELGEDRSRRIDDPVRMYLTQMGEIPLLTRAEEIALAKTIEVVVYASRPTSTPAMLFPRSTTR